MESLFGFFISLVSFLACLLCAALIGRTQYFSFLSERHSRFGCIDGIRGFLALSVFFHHFIISYYWKINGVWKRPPEDLFQNLGKVGVVIFFMITGFLFFSRIVNRSKSIDWIQLYKSRIFRIYPLYVFVLILISLTVFISSGFNLNVPPERLVKEYVKWALFLGRTINDFPETKQIIAGVDWTLKYEWLFYLSLPMIFLVQKFWGKLGLVALALSTLYLFLYPIQFPYISSTFFIYFTIGALISQLATRLEDLIKKQWLIVSILSFLLVLMTLSYPNTLDLFHILMISVLFLFVAAGNNLFTILSSRAALVLGEISYSIYLTHGILLYWAFCDGSGITINHLSIKEYALFMPIFSIVVILFSTLTFFLIEKPGIEAGKKWNLFLKTKASKMAT
ncbi:acyltransferase family protein [Alteromonas sp. D210916BOD_24]|uniref:acyltransferase family protein n=1 Tax=Alteromonas sp. D210916BOD_24 TaxID=3157618 RepID=UPI00399D3B39